MRTKTSRSKEASFARPKEEHLGILTEGVYQERNELIKKEWEAGLGYVMIGRRYGLSPTRVRHIIFPETRGIRSQKRGLKLRPPIKRNRLPKPVPEPPIIPIDNGEAADEFLALLREARLSQRRFAIHMGYDYNAVGHWANGRRRVPLHAKRYLQLLIAYRNDTKLKRDLRLQQEASD